MHVHQDQEGFHEPTPVLLIDRISMCTHCVKVCPKNQKETYAKYGSLQLRSNGGRLVYCLDSAVNFKEDNNKSAPSDSKEGSQPSSRARAWIPTPRSRPMKTPIRQLSWQPAPQVRTAPTSQAHRLAQRSGTEIQAHQAGDYIALNGLKYCIVMCLNETKQVAANRCYAASSYSTPASTTAATRINRR